MNVLQATADCGGLGLGFPVLGSYSPSKRMEYTEKEDKSMPVTDNLKHFMVG